MAFAAQKVGQQGSPVDSMSDCHPDDQGSNLRSGKIREAVFMCASICDRRISMDGKQYFTHSLHKNK